MNQTTKTTADSPCGTESCEVTPTEVRNRTMQPTWKLQDDRETARLLVAMPGASRDQVSISASARLVTIRAPRKLEGANPEEGTLIYELKLRLSPDLNPEATAAVLQNGVLRLEFSRREEAKPRTIPVSG